MTLLTGGDYSRIPNGAPRGLYDAQHLFMPRASFAYSLNAATVIRGGVGVFYDKPEGNVIFSQLNIPPVLDNVTYENFNLSAPSSGAAGAHRRPRQHQRARSEPAAAPSDRTSASASSASSAAATSSRRRMSATAASSCCASPTSTAPASTPCAPTRRCRRRSACRPTSCVPTRATRRSGCALSDAESDYNSLQLYATKRRGDMQFTTSVHARQGHHRRERQRRQRHGRSGGRQSLHARASHASIAGMRLSAPLRIACRSCSIAATCSRRSPAAGRSAARCGCSPASTTPRPATRRSAAAAQTTPAPRSGSTIANELRWFNTDAFTVPAEDAKGTATVGQILGPSFYQWDLSFRKNFRFGGRYQATPIFDVFNLFNRLNFGAPEHERVRRRLRHHQRRPAVAPVPARREVRVLIDADRRYYQCWRGPTPASSRAATSRGARAAGAADPAAGMNHRQPGPPLCSTSLPPLLTPSVQLPPASNLLP